MNFFRKILGLGPKELVNVVHNKKTSPVKVIDETTPALSQDGIFPVLVSEKTKEFDLEGQMVAVFHERENNYANVVIVHILMDKVKLDENGDTEVFQINTDNKGEDYYKMVFENGERNFDNFELPFEFWNPIDKKLDYKVLSCKPSLFASQKIMSKKHMLEAHKLLNTDELLVSIPRMGAIFVCDKKVSKEHRSDFFNQHAYIVLEESIKKEVLCEDIFVVKNGEIDSVFEFTQLSEALNAKA